MSLIILQDRDDVLRATDAGAALAGELLAWDLPAHLELRERGLPHLTPWDVVGAAEFADARRFEQAAQTFWRQQARIPFAGCDLLGVARFRHVAWIARYAWSAYVMRAALKLVAPDEVFVLPEAPAHGLDQPPECRRMPLLQALLRGIAERAGIRIRPVTGEPTRFTDRAAEQSAALGPPVDLAREVAGRPYVIFCGSGIDLLRQLPLISALRADGDVEVVQLYRSADAETRAALRCAGHPVFHEAQVAPPGEGISDDALLRARQAFSAAGADAPADLADVFANPHLAPHYAFLFGDYARRISGQVAAWQRAFDRCPPAAVVALYPTIPLEVAAQRKIPGLALSHGVMTACDTRWFASLPEVLIGAASPAHRDRLLRAGLPAQRVALTGDPGLDALLGTHQPVVPAAAVRASGPTDALRVLLVTSAIAHPAHQSDLPQINWPAAVATFAELHRLARRRPDWQFTIRPHPRYDQPELYAWLQRHTPPAQRWRLDAATPLAEAVAAHDAVVVVNNRSSAIVEASLLGAPVLLLCPDLSGLDLAEWALDAWPRISSVAALESELQTLATDPQHRAQRIQQSQSAAHHFLGEPSPTADRCLPTVRQMITQGGPLLQGWGTT